MLRTRIPLNQIIVAAAVGILSGVYIFKPYFEDLGRHGQTAINNSNSQTVKEHDSSTKE